LSGLLSVLLVISGYVFLRSQYPASLVRYAFNKATDLDLSMEGLTIGPWLRLSMKGLEVSDGREVMAEVSRLDISIDPLGLLGGRVLVFSAGNPVVFLGSLSSAGGGGGGVGGIAIPWFIKSIEVRDALLYRGKAGEAGARALLGPLGLSIRAVSGKRAAFRAEVYLPFLRTTASFGAEIEMTAMGIHGGRVSLGTLRIEELGAEGVPLLRHAKGTIRPEIRFQRKNGALTASFRGEFMGVSLPGLPLGRAVRGRVTASAAFDRAMTSAEVRGSVFLKEPGSGPAAYRAAVLRARYDMRKRDLSIRDAALTVPSVGAVHLRGSVRRLFEKDMALALALSVDDLALPVLDRPLLRPLGVEVLATGRGLRGSASLKGVVSERLEWTLDMKAESPLRYGAYVLDLLASPLRLRAGGAYFVEDDELTVGDMRAGLGRAGGLALSGGLRGLRTAEPRMDFEVSGRGIGIGKILRVVSGPLLKGLSLDGKAGVSLLLRGSPRGPRIHGGVRLSGLVLEGRGLRIGGGEVSLKAGLEERRLSLGGVRFRAASVGLDRGEGGDARAGASAEALRFFGLVFSLGRLTYEKGVVEARGIRLGAERGRVSGVTEGVAPEFIGVSMGLDSARYDGRGMRALGLSGEIGKALLGAGGPLTAGKAMAGKGPLPEVLGSSLKVRSIVYQDRGLGIEGLEIGAEKTMFAVPRPAAGAPHGQRGEPGLLPRLLGTGLSIESLQMKDGQLGARGMSLVVRKALLTRGERVVAVQRKIGISGALEGDVTRKEFRAREVTFSMGNGQGALDGRSRAGRGLLFPGGLALRGVIRDISLSYVGEVRVRCSLDMKEMDAAPFSPFLYALLGKGAEAAGALRARADIDVASGPGGTRLRAGLGLGLRDGALGSADGWFGVEGLGLKTSGEVLVRLPSSGAPKASFSMTTEARGFELLAGGFYGSFKERPVRLTLKGGYDGEQDALRLEGLTLALESVGSLSADGVVSMLSHDPRLDISLGPVEVSNKEAFDFFVRETFRETMPVLAGLEAGGSTGLRLRLLGGLKGLALRGEVRVRGGFLREKEGAGSVRDISMVLPVEIFYPLGGAALGGEAPRGSRGEEDASARRRGRGNARREGVKSAVGALHIGEVSWGGIRSAGIDARPVIKANALSFDGDVVVPLLGGRVVLGDIVYSGLLGPAPGLSLHMYIKGLDLKAASALLGLPPFEGDVTGSIPGIKLSGGRLTTDGEIRLRLFGGEVSLAHMAVSEVFSPVPSFRTDVEIKDLDLGALTRVFEFGRITGILEGSIRDLVIASGQPESFFIDIKTVPRRGVPQRISTKALENVSILGTGAVASVLNRGIYRLFDEYRYSKMGFQAVLKNDELILLGIETQGDKGYIIKGAKFPPKVDVVSHTERISFKEMVRRLERVGFSGEETGREAGKN